MMKSFFSHNKELSMKKLSDINARKTIGLVYDAPYELVGTNEFTFPDDATNEWENKKTLDEIDKTWRSLGLDVIHFPLEKSFFSLWQKYSTTCHLIHSVVEGFGSQARESWIPSLCELSGIPYIGSSPFAHSLCMNKVYLKQICAQLKIPTAPFYFIQFEEDFLNIPNSFFNSKTFMKPNAEGSGMGIDAAYSICSTKKEATELGIQLLKKYPDGILIEKYLSGPEYTSALIGTPTKILPIAQIEVDDGVYGSRNKGKDFMGEKVTFPQLNPKVKQEIINGSQSLFSRLPLHDFARLDWKCDNEGQVYFLEANTLPGISYYYSVLPLMAKEAGYDYPSLFKVLFDSATTRSNERNLWYGKARLQ